MTLKNKNIGRGSFIHSGKSETKLCLSNSCFISLILVTYLTYIFIMLLIRTLWTLHVTLRRTACFTP
jgi:hypothetical protein